MSPVTHEGKFIDKFNDQIAIVRKHVVSDMANPQCCKSTDEIQHSLSTRSSRIWCPDPRGKTPRFCNLGGSGAVPLRLIDAFTQTIPENRFCGALSRLTARFEEMYMAFRTLVLPCTHTDEQAVQAGNDCGCGYLMYLRSDAAAYRFPDGDLVTKLIAARHGDDGYEVLQGNRQNALGALIVRSEEGQDGVLLHPLPMITPMQSHGKFFVWHPQIAERLLDYVSAPMLHVLQEISGCRGVDYRYFRRQLTTVTRKHMEITYQKLASGKPIFHVLITRNGTIDVSIRDGL